MNKLMKKIRKTSEAPKWLNKFVKKNKFDNNKN